MLQFTEQTTADGKHILGCRPSIMEDVPVIMEGVAYAKETLKKWNVRQWQGSYPEREDVENDVVLKRGYTVTCDGEVAGYFVATITEEPIFNAIYDGNWSDDQPYCTLHRSLVTEKFRHSGIADYMMKCVEEYAVSNNVSYIRSDTHADNKPMNDLFVRSGYKYCGKVMYPEDFRDIDRARICYEKRL
ncbi:MAG: GNAT family N-acetyltransferase [Erysipelotrichaceae bacterium]|nr:GNAT family N-acetyltransferase [Erysipelotrichaceae bacterium]